MEIKPFQVFNFLDQDTFNKLKDVKDKLLPYKNKDIFLIPLNKNFSESMLGAYSTLGERIRNFMIEKGYNNPTPNRLGLVRNNRKHVPWHVHPSLGNMNQFLRQEKGKHIIPTERAYVSVFYVHEFTEPKQQGVMGLSKTENGPTEYLFPAIPNSLIIHSGGYGHYAEVEELDPLQDRLSCYIHWVTDP